MNMEELRKKNHKEFVEKASSMHNNKYDYSKFVYYNAKTPSIIICPIHGEFLQKADLHTRKNAIGCPQCCEDTKGERAKERIKLKPLPPKAFVPKEEFLKRAKIKFGDKFTYDLENYNGLEGESITIFCEKHGIFKKSPSLFLLGYGCSDCGKEQRIKNKTKPYEETIEKAKTIHNNFYIYPSYNKDIYISRSKSVIDIICPKHGLFKKNVEKHLSGQGCFRCRMEELVKDGVLVGGYNETIFERNPQKAKEEGVLYYLSINNGEYYKIGITTNLKNRVRALQYKGKEIINTIKVVDTYEDTLKNTYYLEQKLLKLNEDKRISLDFSTEIFAKDIRRTKVYKEIFKR